MSTRAIARMPFACDECLPLDSRRSDGHIDEDEFINLIKAEIERYGKSTMCVIS